MSHEVETMAYAAKTEVPWHGLGNTFSPKASLDAKVKAAGLDWGLEMRPLMVNVGTEKKPVYVNAGRKALMRDSDKRILTVTGDNWKPLQPRAVIEFFEDYCEAGGATLETAGSLRGGKVIWGLASLHDKFTINGNDTVKGYILLISPNEVGKSISVRTTTVRVVCANTMAMAVGGYSAAIYKQNHLTDFDPDAAKKTIGLIRRDFAEAKLNAQVLSKTKMTELEGAKLVAWFLQGIPDDIDTSKLVYGRGAKSDERAFTKFVEELLSNTDNQSKAFQGVMASINTAPGAQPETAWGVLNGFTHWCDHVAGREADARMFNSWLGEKSRLKINAQSALLEFAGK